MAATPYQLGCVSYLNSKPLIEPLVDDKRVAITFAVPSALLGLMNRGAITAGLLSVVDYQQSEKELVLIPAGMIGCDGPTLTVRIFSRLPPRAIRTLHADTDSHTSVILAQILLAKCFAARPTIVPLDPAQSATSTTDAMLLIGDKVVTKAPDAAMYPHQFDLGEQWKLLTGLPFVFAMWMGRADVVDRPLAQLLAAAREVGATRTEELVERYAVARGWPPELLIRYFTHYLRYAVTSAAREGLSLFFQLATEMQLLNLHRPIRYSDV
jgi:chorismate dehydratase